MTPPTIRDLVPIRRALISVSDKSGLLALAAALAGGEVEMVSTGSTARQISEAGYPVTEVSEVTGFPESLDGRVKTLHPAVHAGILADLRRADHEVELSGMGFAPFELVVVNLYPFVETVASGAEVDAVIEQVDIGGPAMVRSAAKNHANVTIVVSPSRYDDVIAALNTGGTSLAQRRRMAAEAFAHTAAYDAAVAEYFASHVAVGEGAAKEARVELVFGEPTILRYGENAHQSATLFRSANGCGIAQAAQLHGKEMSYNNYVDADAALRAAYDFAEPAVAIIKHANPCGIAVAADIATAHRLAHECDPVSAFGGVIAANRPVDTAAAESIKDIFTEVIIAPGFTDGALAVLTAKKNLRLLQLPVGYTREALEWRQVSGGLLEQVPDTHFAAFDDWTLVAGQHVDAAVRADLEFAWRAVRAVKSNAILLAHGGASVGVGMGQVNRVDSCKLAVERAGDRARGSVAASDAFFPFADGLQILLDAGVCAVVQPGGSVRDKEVIAAAKESGVAMYFSGERHFFH
ncbi:MAG: bifunctional phosphoribosylaminoimidazolecarboxamide formyltransferase/IMP cyclohydrolase [Microbacteriaceae bacterium]|nr:bifunctional phosphoribosylaminoimidazolecarboxamide formyltransferase/IMP cyclohydrolase [Microbacteriaceae bacterium]